jgi:hypothetical protein
MAIFLFVTAGAAAYAQDVAPSKPLDPVQAILDAFRSHDIVALGEGAHGNEQGHAFRLALIRDPRFSGTVNDILVEFGNARHQDLIDRFVRGGDVSDEALRQVWQDTTQVTTVWDLPIYEEFFRAVRAVNAKLPSERQIRVLLGDPPIDWGTVQTFEDFSKWMANGNRDRHPAEVVRREVLAKNRRALIIYGDAHLARVPTSPSQTIVQLLEGAGGKRVFTISSPSSMPQATDLRTLQSDIASWRVPTIALLRGTTLGLTEFTTYFLPAAAIPPGKPRPPVPEKLQGLRMEDQFDAVLYLGDPAAITMSRMSATRCADASYMQMRLQRLALMPAPLSKIQGDRVKADCAR